MLFTVLDYEGVRFLDEDDSNMCFFLGEYTSGGGFRASETNRQILNFKKSPTASERELYWKRQGINYWARQLLDSNLQFDICARDVTFIPMPCSKPFGHPEHDDRILRMLRLVGTQRPGLDIRPLLRQSTIRDAQHIGERLDPHEIASSLEVDPGLVQSLRPTLMIVDDVITRGASFAAAKSLVRHLPGVRAVQGIFLAKTVHAEVEWTDFLE